MWGPSPAFGRRAPLRPKDGSTMAMEAAGGDEAGRQRGREVVVVIVVGREEKGGKEGGMSEAVPIILHVSASPPIPLVPPIDAGL
ncbi:hypothetical protein E2C01_082646 [Portunus trituberculatus]|uniref:Uncharacterized protein n=1 Tax=Portunus trituberculatus TaxID=210409 RepID=A0A5B7IZU2_PORTR|nr:hypothetical protein [Portunus trituberculatus]